MKKKIKEKTFMLIGDPSCGKTTLMKVLDCEVNPGLPTVYYKFLTREKTKGFRKKTKKVLLSLWDAPARDWNDTRQTIYPHLDAAVIMFAVDDAHSLENARDKWYNELRQLCPKKIPVILVGNKSDLRENPEVSWKLSSYEEGLAMAERMKAYAYAECSAINKEGTTAVFSFLVQSVIKKSKCQIL